MKSLALIGAIEPQPFPRAVRVLGLAILFVSALALFSNANGARQMDFISFWAAGKLVLAGDPTAAYDVQAHKAVQLTLGSFERLMPFPYPPPFLLFVTPFAFIPYGLSAIVWAVGTFALYVTAVQRISPSSGRLAAAFPPVLVNGIVAQNGLLTGGIFFWGMSLIASHPLRAGLLLGCLIIKPQLAVLLPLALVAGGHWRAFLGAAVSTVALLGSALLIFGVESYFALARLAPLYSAIAADGLVGWHKMASVYASLRLAGVPAEAAWGAHLLIAAAAAFVVWKSWRSDVDLGAKTAILASASMLVSPYLYLYDTVILLLPLLWLMRSGADPRLVAALWCIPLVVTLQHWGLNDLVNPAPLLPIALLVLIRRQCAASGRIAHHEPRTIEPVPA